MGFPIVFVSGPYEGMVYIGVNEISVVNPVLTAMIVQIVGVLYRHNGVSQPMERENGAGHTFKKIQVVFLIQGQISKFFHATLPRR